MLGRRDGVAVVTGASSGIGAAIARELAQAGHPVLAVARRADRLEALAADAARAGEAVIHPLALDVTDGAAPGAIAERARALGPIAWLVNNAGTVRFGAFDDAAPDDHVRQVRLNCEAVVALTATLLGDLARGAAILNVASVAAFLPLPRIAVYAATKAFVLSFSEALAEELRPRGVTVTALCPGPVTTEIFDVGAPGVPRRAAPGELSAAECARFAVEAARRGEVVAIPGAMSKLNAWGAQVAPRAVARRLGGWLALRMLGFSD